MAQTLTEGNWYATAQLSQEPVNVTKELYPTGSMESGDSTLTLYGESSIDFKIYFINGDQYDPVFNPNPTGIILNNQEFQFYCGMEMSLRQNYSNVLQANEFSFLGKNYLVLISFREDCLGDNCRYRCYNLFDITNPKRIVQTSFSSIFEGVESFGEFNNDGQLDFVRFAPKAPEGGTAADADTHYLITCYNVGNGTPKQLSDQGNSYYLFAEGDEGANQFQILKAYWFFDVKGQNNQSIEKTTYFTKYISFDPYHTYLYNPEGVRIEKNQYSVHVEDFGDLEAALTFCNMMMEYFDDVYIMIDQYTGNISYQVYIGNFTHRQKAEDYQRKLLTFGMRGNVSHFRKNN
ncbi:hypothetical protein GCM10023331_11010 [Algivirga pacifica]|uniref:SPOR domain-containing protein n=1 Tax=Algivirga pacifica TaxID=1162670 RepID=A0ABP9D5A5_9BACT